MAFVKVKLTDGNIRNNHIYLRSVLDIFPPSTIGGPNKTELAPQNLTLHCGQAEPVVTDIAGDKKIFRRRGWQKSFFESHNLQEGDSVVIEKVGDYEYHVYPSR
jgi:hypothetical protein